MEKQLVYTTLSESTGNKIIKVLNQKWVNIISESLYNSNKMRFEVFCQAKYDSRRIPTNVLNAIGSDCQVINLTLLLD